MAHESDDTFPPALVAVSAIDFESRYHEADDDHDDDWGVDFMPSDRFVDAADTTGWLQAWTANPTVSGDDFRFFGQDGCGGMVGLWLAVPGSPLTDQPVVFLGSEGEVGVVAENLSDFLWVLADGLGPAEVIGSDAWTATPDPELEAIAAQHATTPRRPLADLVRSARGRFPEFTSTIEALAR